MRRLLLYLLLLVYPLCLLCSLPLLAAPAEQASEELLSRWTTDELVTAAAQFASRFPLERSRSLQFVSVAHKRTAAGRLLALQTLGFIFNSLSRNDAITLPAFVPDTDGALAWFDLACLRDRDDIKGIKALLASRDKLGQLGSGIAPFREPYFTVASTRVYHHEVTEYQECEYGWWVDEHGKEWREEAPGRTWKRVSVKKGPVKVNKEEKAYTLSPTTATAKANMLALTNALGTPFPIFDYRWLAYNALAEPRYHELLGLDDTEQSVLDFALAEEHKADRIGSQVRGAILFSPVGTFNRVLERTGTQRKYNRGSFHRSIDFRKAILGSDVLRDTLISDGDAFEIIYSLPNGLQGYSVINGKQNRGQRLDKADADIAQAHEWKDNQVRTAYVCMGCHLREKGWIEVNDSVRDYQRNALSVAVQAFERKKSGNYVERGRKVRQKYLTIDYNELLQADQALVESSILAATGGADDPKNGLTPSSLRRELITTIKDYLEKPVSAEELAWELGTSERRLIQTISGTPGLHHALAGFLTGESQRRDQVESAFGDIATILYVQRRK